MKLRFLLGLGGALAIAALPAVAAAVMLWTLVMAPLTTTANVSTNFSLTATNADALTELGCLEVDLPPSFVIESLGTPVASNGRAWESYRTGNVVIVHSLSGGGRLALLQTVRFTILAHATAAGAFTWPNHAHRAQDCSTTDQVGVPLAVTVLPALVPTPTPTPSPTATPAPTPTPTPTATPALTAAPTATPKVTPSPIPTLPLPSIPLPSIPLPSTDPLPTPRPTPAPAGSSVPGATATPEPSRSAEASSGSGGIASEPPAGGSSGGSAGGTLTIARGLDDGGADAEVGVDVFGLLDADFVWFVPAASMAVPGLLVIVWVLLQTIGALAWIPAVRRMSRESMDRRKRTA
jgi:hypothetical protein